MLVVKKRLNDNFEPVFMAKKFINYMKLGELLAYQLCLGRNVVVELEDRLGNGTIYINDNNENNVTFIEFEEIREEDIVQIEYNKLGIIKRLYK